MPAGRWIEAPHFHMKWAASSDLHSPGKVYFSSSCEKAWWDCGYEYSCQRVPCQSVKPGKRGEMYVSRRSGSFCWGKECMPLLVWSIPFHNFCRIKFFCCVNVSILRSWFSRHVIFLSLYEQTQLQLFCAADLIAHWYSHHCDRVSSSIWSKVHSIVTASMIPGVMCDRLMCDWHYLFTDLTKKRHGSARMT